MDTISAYFENDHREIDEILRNTAFEEPARAREAFGEFHRRLERHIEWEEQVLFPAVARRAPTLGQGPLRVMKLEHEMIRKHKAAAIEALKAGDGAAARRHAEAMTGVLAGHNHKEEQVLYPACDGLLSAEEARAVLARVRSA